MTTVELSENGKVTLPKEYCRKNNLTPGTPMRMLEVGASLLMIPQQGPTLEEFEHLVATTGVFDREATPEEEKLLDEVIAMVRAEAAAKKQ